MILVRPRAWWYNKVPLTVTTMLLLFDGQDFTKITAVTLATTVLTVCAVGNYGYAMNELFDIEEDTRSGRINAAVTTGVPRMWGIIVLSALCAEFLAAVAGGTAAAVLTMLVLCLPAAYSVPPLRVKERKWIGVAADATAAHVYPAMLALLSASFWQFRVVPLLLFICTIIWSVAVGVRGILSHQLHTSDRDTVAGLSTVVHDLGHRRLEFFILVLIIPIEVAGFGGMLIFCHGGVVLWAFVILYLIYEGFKTASGRFSVTAFRPQGQRYLPFVEESFYKAWGPIVLALDAARIDLAYLAVVAVYVLLFKPHVIAEAQRIRQVWAALQVKRAAGKAEGET